VETRAHSRTLGEPPLLLEARGLEKSFAPIATGRGSPLFTGLDLVVGAGERLAIVGPSGSGKSTLLAILAGLEEPSAGTVLWKGRDLATLDERARVRLRAREFGFLFQAQHLLPQLSALENALVPALARAAGGDPAAAEARARELSKKVGLAERLHHRPAELSGGERARVALVRALVNRPSLLFADEPTGALDARTAEELGTLLLELNRSEGVALVVVTHSERLAARLGRVLALEDARLVER
jgi:lipoprotein-releasing system ATP-binding protein